MRAPGFLNRTYPLLLASTIYSSARFLIFLILCLWVFFLQFLFLFCPLLFFFLLGPFSALLLFNLFLAAIFF